MYGVTLLQIVLAPHGVAAVPPPPAPVPVVAPAPVQAAPTPPVEQPASAPASVAAPVVTTTTTLPPAAPATVTTGAAQTTSTGLECVVVTVGPYPLTYAIGPADGSGSCAAYDGQAPDGATITPTDETVTSSAG